VRQKCVFRFVEARNTNKIFAETGVQSLFISVLGRFRSSRRANQDGPDSRRKNPELPAVVRAIAVFSLCDRNLTSTTDSRGDVRTTATPFLCIARASRRATRFQCASRVLFGRSSANFFIAATGMGAGPRFRRFTSSSSPLCAAIIPSSGGNSSHSWSPIPSTSLWRDISIGRVSEKRLDAQAVVASIPPGDTPPFPGSRRVPAPRLIPALPAASSIQSAPPQRPHWMR
jgi:hypothetical protein